MIPKGVYDFVRYGSGALPGASMTQGKHEYILSCDHGSVICTRYNELPDINAHNYTMLMDVWHSSIMRDFRLSNIPDSDSSQWSMYFTNEC